MNSSKKCQDSREGPHPGQYRGGEWRLERALRQQRPNSANPESEQQKVTAVRQATDGGSYTSSRRSAWRRRILSRSVWSYASRRFRHLGVFNPLSPSRNQPENIRNLEGDVK